MNVISDIENLKPNQITRREFCATTSLGIVSTILSPLIYAGCNSTVIKMVNYEEKREDVFNQKWDCNQILPIPIEGCYTGTNKGLRTDLKEKPNKNYKNYVRWKDFNIVADRLNSPKLIHHYIDNNFRYQRGDFPPAYTTFKRKYGNCTALADFGKFLLKKAGYKTFVRSVDFSGPPCTSDHTGSGIILDNGKYQLTVDFCSSGNRMINEPIDLDMLDDSLSYGYPIIGRRWGHRNNSCNFYD